jgi:geranylgeranyl reductase
MKNKYDVIIIGAGPGGLKCAETLKNSKLSVILIEKNKIIGPKVCGGGLTKLTENFDIPKNKTRSFKKTTLVLLDKKYEINLSNPLRTIDRYDLGQYMLKKIKSSKNIDIIKGVLVKTIKKNKIITDKGVIHFKHLIGADGSNSIVRKYLGLENQIYMGIQYKIPKITKEMIWLFKSTKTFMGYMYIFPHKRFTCAGIAFSPRKISSLKARDLLHETLDSQNLICKKAKYECATINCLYSGVNFNNLFLIGDAAGLVSPLTGEGISYALISGEEVAKKILNSSYKMPKLKKLLKIRKRHEKILFFLEKPEICKSFFEKRRL